MTQYARTDDGVHIGYRVRGRGDHDLLIPSYGTCSVSSFDDEPHCARFLARLESFARLITFDMRGIGLSDPVDPPFAPEQQAADARAVLDAAGSERATYLAWFLWGPSALTLAVEHPERLHALVAVNTGARFSRAPDYPAGVPPEFLSRFRDEVVAIGLGTRADVHQVVTWHAPSVADDERFVRWWVEAGQKGASPATAGAVLDMFRDVDVRSLLPSITVPTVVIQRRDTAWIRPAVGYYLAEHIPGARLVDIPGADMTPFTENSDAVIGEIEEVVTGRRTAPDPDRVLATVLFTDIVGSTEQAARLGDQHWREVLDRHDDIARRHVEQFGGHVVKATGDGTLATFDSPTRAVRAACALRDAVRSIGIEVRAGVHIGEIERRGDDVGGIAVHIGARVMTLAAASEVDVTSTVKDLVAGSGFDFADRGEHELRGVPGSWRVFVVAE